MGRLLCPDDRRGRNQLDLDRANEMAARRYRSRRPDTGTVDNDGDGIQGLIDVDFEALDDGGELLTDE
jgi:hypothetical protein